MTEASTRASSADNPRRGSPGFRKFVSWTLLALSLLLVLSGLGIVYSRVVELLALGILEKNVSFQLHQLLWAPFLVALAFHVALRRK